MLTTDEFEKWIEASHIMFEIFEGRYEIYPLARKWIQNWFSSEVFLIEKEDIERISNLFNKFDYEVYDVKEEELKKKINGQLMNLLKNNFNEGINENIGFAVSSYLFTWNFQRFKKYFKKNENFNVEYYFKSLGEFLKNERDKLNIFRNKKLVSDQIEREKIEEIFNEVNNKLREIGIGNNEPIGTIKLVHIFAPYYFPLIDNYIARATGVLRNSRWDSLESDSYMRWMNALKNWLQNYFDVIEEIERKYNSSILKLVDEGLYMMSTIKQRTRVAGLGIRVE